MNKLPIIIINTIDYYNVEDLAKVKPDYFSVCSNKLRTIITWKKIPEAEYIYAYLKDNKWIISTVKYARSKLLLTKKFSESNILNKKTTETKKIIIKDKPNDESYEQLPPLIELTDEEKFKNTNGDILNIEVRGIREHDKIYFKGSDIEKEFVMPQLVKDIFNKNTNYEYGIHYKFYCGENLTTVENKENTKINTLYLTYFGLVRCLFVSKGNRISEQFQEWAIKKLFTHQFGTIEQKKSLAGNLLGIPYSEMKRFLNVHINEIPCVYLISLGLVKDLRQSMNISDNFIDDSTIFKFGFTKDFKQRWQNHKIEYEKIKDVKLSLKNISIIDAEHISNAERDIKNSLYRYSFTYNKHEELIIVPNKDTKDVENIYSLINYKYCCYNKELNKQIDNLKNEIKDKDSIIMQKNIEIEKQQLLTELEKEKSNKKDIQIELLQQKLYIKELELKIIVK
jgi:hypothetical protein